LREVEAAKAAAATGQGPPFYGVVQVDDGFAYAMGRQRGNFPVNESRARPGSPEYRQAERQASQAHSDLSPQAPYDVRNFGDALLHQGYYARGDIQGLIGPDGRWRPIDSGSIFRLPDDPSLRKQALQEHAGAVESEARSLEQRLAARQSGSGPGGSP
jgi:hypothetical protein